MNVNDVKNFLLKYAKWICLILVIVSFGLSLGLGLNGIDNAKQYYNYYGDGCIFIFETWFFLLSVIVTHIGLFLIVLLIDIDRIYKMLIIICVISLTLVGYLLTYKFIPSITDTSSVRTRVISILNIVFISSLFFLISRNSDYSPIAYIFIVFIGIVNAFVSTLNIKQPF
jgi:hypothetical protein